MSLYNLIIEKTRCLRESFLCIQQTLEHSHHHLKQRYYDTFKYIYTYNNETNKHI